MDTHEVSKLAIRSNWLVASGPRDYDALLLQAFIYLVSEKDYLFAVESDFPEDVQQQLKENMVEVKTKEHKEKLQKHLKSLMRKLARTSTLSQNVDWGLLCW